MGAVGTVLLGVVDRDNVALWLELTTETLFNLGEEKGGRRGLTLAAAC